MFLRQDRGTRASASRAVNSATAADQAAGFRVGAGTVCSRGRTLQLLRYLQIDIGGILAAVLQQSFGVSSDASSA